jgi:hypothetical protein
MFTSFGPVKFDITLGSTAIPLCMKLTATANANEFDMYTGDRGATSCSGVTLTHKVATITLDDTGTIQSSNFGKTFGGHSWLSMSGSFNESEGTGSGSINTADSPRGTNGSWAAGGVDRRPLPHSQTAGHGHDV